MVNTNNNNNRITLSTITAATIFVVALIAIIMAVTTTTTITEKAYGQSSANTTTTKADDNTSNNSSTTKLPVLLIHGYMEDAAVWNKLPRPTELIRVESTDILPVCVADFKKPSALLAYVVELGISLPHLYV